LCRRRRELRWPSSDVSVASCAPSALLVRGASLATSMSEYLVKRLTSNPRVVIHTRTEIEGLHGADVLSAITTRTSGTGERERRDTRALFLMTGATAF